MAKNRRVTKRVKVVTVVGGAEYELEFRNTTHAFYGNLVPYLQTLCPVLVWAGFDVSGVGTLTMGDMRPGLHHTVLDPVIVRPTHGLPILVQILPPGCNHQERKTFYVTVPDCIPGQKSWKRLLAAAECLRDYFRDLKISKPPSAFPACYRKGGQTMPEENEEGREAAPPVPTATEEVSGPDAALLQALENALLQRTDDGLFVGVDQLVAAVRQSYSRNEVHACLSRMIEEGSVERSLPGRPVDHIGQHLRLTGLDGLQRLPAREALLARIIGACFDGHINKGNRKAFRERTAQESSFAVPQHMYNCLSALKARGAVLHDPNSEEYLLIWDKAVVYPAAYPVNGQTVDLREPFEETDNSPEKEGTVMANPIVEPADSETQLNGENTEGMPPSDDAAAATGEQIAPDRDWEEVFGLVPSPYELAKELAELLKKKVEIHGEIVAALDQEEDRLTDLQIEQEQEDLRLTGEEKRLSEELAAVQEARASNADRLEGTKYILSEVAKKKNSPEYLRAKRDLEALRLLTMAGELLQSE